MIRIKTKTKKKKKKATSRNHIHSINATNKSVISSATNRTENTSDEQKQTNTIANYFDYQINQTKKKKKNRRYLLLYGFPIVIILLTILIILPILFLNQSTIITSTSLITNPCYPISRCATLNASSFYLPAGTPTQQADGLLDRLNTSGGTYFNTGALAPQWIQLELPGLFNILTITLKVAQSPNGLTRHQISVGSISSSLQIVTDLNSSTTSGQILNLTYNPILTNVRFIRLATITSPSWVAWQKFIVYNC